MAAIVVGSAFNGPPDSGNGGYTCGLVAAAYGALRAAEVTLRLPPPLDTPLTLDGDTVIDDEGRTVATVTEATVEADPPPFPGYDAAHAARERYAGLHDHPFPTCFVCGPRRDDGLDLRPGPIRGSGLVATTYTPRDSSPETTWAALDCPGAWALVQTGDAPIVLGRLAVRIDKAPTPGTPHVVTGWRAREREGRKHFAGTALYDAAGTLLAIGRATWIAVQSAS